MLNMSSSYIPMKDEYRKLVELGRNTVHDWVYAPKFGFFSQHGYYIDQIGDGYYDAFKTLTGAGDCQINYVSHPLYNDTIIRLPTIAILSIIGMLIGFIGFIKFTKHSSKLTLSFVFFMFMNISGLLFHSLLPISSKYRIFFALIDKASTGVSGTFLALELLSMLNHSDNKVKDMSTNEIIQSIAIVFILFLLSNIDILSELIYIGGCVAVFCSCLWIIFTGFMSNLSDRINSSLMKPARHCVVLFTFWIITTPMNRILCESSGNVVNFMSIIFAISDIGFGIMLYYGLKYFEYEENDSKKNK